MRFRCIAVAAVLVTAVLGAPAGALAGPGETGPAQAMPGLQHPVRVVRDRLGIPHVYARSDHDAFFVNGYLHAQDRLFEMDDLRRQADGTRAELLGAGSGDEVLAFDVFMRTFGLRRAAERSAAAYPDWVMADLRAHADGVNLWLARNPLRPVAHERGPPGAGGEARRRAQRGRGGGIRGGPLAPKPARRLHEQPERNAGTVETLAADVK